MSPLNVVTSAFMCRLLAEWHQPTLQKSEMTFLFFPEVVDD